MDAEQWALHLQKTIMEMRHNAFRSDIEILLRDPQGDLKYRLERDFEHCTVFDSSGTKKTILPGSLFDEIQDAIDRKITEIYDTASSALSESLILRLSQSINISLANKHDGMLSYQVSFNNGHESWILNSNNFLMKIKDENNITVGVVKTPDVVFQIFEILSDRAIEINKQNMSGFEYE